LVIEITRTNVIDDSNSCNVRRAPLKLEAAGGGFATLVMTHSLAAVVIAAFSSDLPARFINKMSADLNRFINDVSKRKHKLDDDDGICKKIGKKYDK
jgi:hypothetical protein